MIWLDMKRGLHVSSMYRQNKVKHPGKQYLVEQNIIFALILMQPLKAGALTHFNVEETVLCPNIQLAKVLGTITDHQQLGQYNYSDTSDGRR